MTPSEPLADVKPVSLLISVAVSLGVLQELERLNQVLEEEKMKFEEVVLELKAEQEHIRL